MSLLIVRLVVFVLLFWAGFKLWQLWQRLPASKLDQADTSSSGKVESDASEQMLACAHCGIHLPKSEVIQAPQGYFCSPEHLLEYKQEHSN